MSSVRPSLTPHSFSSRPPRPSLSPLHLVIIQTPGTRYRAPPRAIWVRVPLQTPQALVLHPQRRRSPPAGIVPPHEELRMRGAGKRRVRGWVTYVPRNCTPNPARGAACTRARTLPSGIGPLPSAAIAVAPRVDPPFCISAPPHGISPGGYSLFALPLGISGTPVDSVRLGADGSPT
eukprot:scaffold3113_cov67-Isochrysis_galbana.AAC.2